jgi:hypothetical protein
MNRTKIIFFLILSAALVGGGICYISDNSPNRQLYPKNETEKYLKTAEITKVEKNVGGGRTDFWKVTLNDGKTERAALFKYLNRTRPRAGADSYKYELAAYTLNKMMDLDLIPPVVQRYVDSQTGSLQIRVDGFTTLRNLDLSKTKPQDPEKFQQYMDNIGVFENLTICDRDDADIMIHKVTEKVYRVDFSMAFYPDPELILIPDIPISRCSKKFYENLSKLDDSTLRSSLRDYLNEDEIETLLIRKKLIQETIKKLIEKNGIDAVLF